MPTATEYHSRATSLRLAGDMMGAVENYKQVLALVPDSATTWNELGTALRSLGRFDEAVDCFRRALALKPDLADAYRNLALGEQLSADNSELASIAALVDATDLAIEDRSTAAFALGKALDDAGRFDEAFTTYERANSMYRAARAAAGDWFDAVALSRQVDEIIAAFTPDFFAKVAGWGIRSEVPVFIVGMPRSGTSLVEQIAASHSRVSGAGELLRTMFFISGWWRHCTHKLRSSCVDAIRAMSLSHASFRNSRRARWVFHTLWLTAEGDKCRSTV
jgi:tetratricopeptide (TPR) repeat protein